MSGSVAEDRVSYHWLSDSTAVGFYGMSLAVKIFVIQIHSSGPEITKAGGLLKRTVITTAVTEHSTRHGRTGCMVGLRGVVKCSCFSWRLGTGPVPQGSALGPTCDVYQ